MTNLKQEAQNSDVEYNAENDFLTQNAKSSAKLKRTAKGFLTWEIKVVSKEEDLMDKLVEKAIEMDKKIMNYTNPSPREENTELNKQEVENGINN